MNWLENIKHRDHVLQKVIDHYYKKNSQEGIDDMGKKPNVVKEDITPPIPKKNIDTVNRTEKP